MRLRCYLALSALFLALPTINTKNSVAAISQVSPSQAQITILYDAFGQNSRMQKDWGYAALVEYGGKRILFDTGNNPRILAENAKAKGIDLTKLDFVVMSHRHGDHKVHINGWNKDGELKVWIDGRLWEPPAPKAKPTRIRHTTLPASLPAN